MEKTAKVANNMNDKQIEILAKEAKEKKDNNLAIVLHVYLGSKKAGIDALFASHCQDFARRSMKLLEEMEEWKKTGGRRN